MAAGPTPPKTTGRYYGWVVVWSLFVVTGVVMSMGGANLGFFLKPMRDELGFDRVDFGWMNTARVLGGAVTATFLGRFIDRYGPRYLLAVLGVLIAVLMVMMAFVTSAWQAIAIFGLMGVIGFQGGGQILTTITPAKWFVRGRARAMGYVYLGIPVSIIFAFPLTQFLIDQWGWERAWIILGIGGGLLTTPLALFLLRRQPEDMGLLPDGVDPAEAQGGAGGQWGGAQAVEEHQWTRAEAVRTPAFWALSFAFGIQLFSMSTIGVFRIPHFQDQGIDDTLVSWLGPMDGLTSVAIVFSMVMLVGRFGSRGMTTTGFLLLALNNVLMVLTREPIMMFISAAAWGFSLAILSVMQNTMWADYFGRRNLGSIRGLAMMGMLAFSAVGAPLTGWIGDTYGSLAPIWWASAAGLTMSALVVWVTPRPAPPDIVEAAGSSVADAQSPSGGAGPLAGDSADGASEESDEPVK